MYNVMININLILIAIIVALKFLLPVTIIFFPFAAGWINFILDSIDGDILIPLGLNNSTYQPIDKIADWVTYIGIVIYAYKAQWPIKKLILGLFIFRSIGQALFLTTGNELIFFYFPNFLEPVFLVAASFLAYQRVIKKQKNWQSKAFATMKRHRFIIITAIVVYKMQDEFFTHVANVDRTELIQKLFGG